MGNPVGNLTSQLFANVYGHRLDMFVKHTLKAKYYIRYMDDFIILSDNLEELQEWFRRIEEFLEKEIDVYKRQAYGSRKKYGNAGSRTGRRI